MSILYEYDKNYSRFKGHLSHVTDKWSKPYWQCDLCYRSSKKKKNILHAKDCSKRRMVSSMDRAEDS